jgi:hypothetical protein
MTPTEFVKLRNHLRRLVELGREAQVTINDLTESQKREVMGMASQECGGCGALKSTRDMRWHEETALAYCVKCARAFDPSIHVHQINMKFIKQ